MGCGWGLVAPAHRSATILWPRITCYFNERYCLFFGWPVQRLITVELKIVKNDQKLSEALLSDRRFVTRIISLRVFLHFFVGYRSTNQELSSGKSSLERILKKS